MYANSHIPLSIGIFFTQNGKLRNHTILSLPLNTHIAKIIGSKELYTQDT